MITFEKNRATLKDVHNLVCYVTNIGYYELFKDTRKREIVEKRQLFCYLSKKYTKETLDGIGRYIGVFRRRDYDHATVLHAYKTIKGHLTYDKHLVRLVDIMNDQLEFVKSNSVVVGNADLVKQCLINTSLSGSQEVALSE